MPPPFNRLPLELLRRARGRCARGGAGGAAGASSIRRRCGRTRRCRWPSGRAIWPCFFFVLRVSSLCVATAAMRALVLRTARAPRSEAALWWSQSMPTPYACARAGSR